MSTPYTVIAGDRSYTVVDDRTWVYRALITGAVRDEITGDAPAGTLDIRTTAQGVQIRSAGLGIYGVSGYPERSIPDAAASYTFDLSVVAEGYRPAGVSVLIAPNAALPVTAPEVLLRRLPVQIAGRVVNDVNGSPVPGARVELVTPLAVALHLPARFAHAAGVAVRARGLAPEALARSVVTAAPAGGTRVILDNQTGLAPDDVVLFDPAREAEYAIVDSLAPVGVNLTAPLNRSFSPGTVVRRIVPGAVVASSTLAQPCEAGEAVLLLSSNLAASAVEIDDPPHREFHALGARTSAQGYYSSRVLPG